MHLFLIFLMSMPQANSPAMIPHDDMRGTPKIQWRPGPPPTISAKGDASIAAWSYLQKHHADYGLSPSLESLKLVRTRESQVGRHFRFQQYLHGYPIEGAELVVTVSHEGDRILQIFNNVWPMDADQKQAAPVKLISKDKAYDLAWEHLRVHGELLAEPRQATFYLPENGGFRLVRSVHLPVAAPNGYWRHDVDAQTGEIVHVASTLQTRKRPAADFTAYKGAVLDRRETFARYQARSKSAKQTQAVKSAQGSALVFDPDPRTVLADENLADDSPASAFEAAYQRKTLSDITQVGGVYKLEGPWLKIVNFQSPHTEPSTSSDGSWNGKRGDSAFNDVNAYYHIDQNQRYIQSLGFKDATGIRQEAVSVDTDAAFGEDHSFYDPVTNRLGLGRGCVDDAEDADVILHEYGHAIQLDLIPNWRDGDTGAMGEGFGDYWAASYSYGTENGADFHPEWVFSWDGHNACWGGRILNAENARYSNRNTYQAGQVLPSGDLAEELWSTVLFQSMSAIVAKGGSKAEVDRIILQSHFGLGAGLTMQEMAYTIIETARNLHPNGVHAATFERVFSDYQFVTSENLPNFNGSILEIETSGENKIADPGEMVTFKVTVGYNGPALEQVNGTLTVEDPRIEAIKVQSPFEMIFIEGYHTLFRNETGFELQLPNTVTCGSSIPLKLNLTYTMEDGQQGESTVDALLTTGFSNAVERYALVGLSVPDNDPNGLSSEIEVNQPNTVIDAGLQLQVTGYHTYPRDIRLELETPAGDRLELPLFVELDILTSFNRPFTTSDALAPLIGQPLAGKWTLHVYDDRVGDVGRLVSWSLYQPASNLCSDKQFSRLYFSFSEENDSWETEVGLINPNAAEVNLTLNGYDEEGALVAAVQRQLPPFGRLYERVKSLFSSSRVASIKVDGDGEIHGYSQSANPARTHSFAVGAADTRQMDLRVPHIAESDLFWTIGRIANWERLLVYAAFSSGTRHYWFGQDPIPPNASQRIDFKEEVFYGNPIPSGGGWGRFDGNQTPRLTGIEIFGQDPLFSNSAGLNLSEAAGTTLIMPHIPADKTVWWAGLVLVNMEPTTYVEVNASGYDAQGQLIAQHQFRLNPSQKKSALVQDFFPNQDVNNVAWVSFTSDEPLVGYELFGTHDRNGGIAGLEALDAGATRQVIGHLQTNDNGRWTGLAMLNPADAATNLTLQAYGDDGNTMGDAVTISLPAKGKRIGLAKDLLPVIGSGWILITSDQPVIVSELFGENGFEMINGLNALR